MYYSSNRKLRADLIPDKMVMGEKQKIARVSITQGVRGPWKYRSASLCVCV